MFTFSIILAIFSSFLAISRISSEIIVTLGYDLTGELDEALNLIVTTVKELHILTILELVLLFSLAIWVYFFGLTFCAKMCFFCFTLTYWPQRFLTEMYNKNFSFIFVEKDTF